MGEGMAGDGAAAGGTGGREEGTEGSAGPAAVESTVVQEREHGEAACVFLHAVGDASGPGTRLNTWAL